MTPGQCWFYSYLPSCWGEAVQQGAGWPAMGEPHSWLWQVLHLMGFGCPTEHSPPCPSGMSHNHGPSPSHSSTTAAFPSSLWVTSPWALQMASALFTGQGFLCPQESLGPHSANHGVAGNWMCWRGVGGGGRWGVASPLSQGCSAMSSLSPGTCQVGLACLPRC